MTDKPDLLDAARAVVYDCTEFRDGDFDNLREAVIAEEERRKELAKGCPWILPVVAEELISGQWIVLGMAGQQISRAMHENKAVYLANLINSTAPPQAQTRERLREIAKKHAAKFENTSRCAEGWEKEIYAVLCEATGLEAGEC